MKSYTQPRPLAMSKLSNGLQFSSSPSFLPLRRSPAPGSQLQVDPKHPTSQFEPDTVEDPANTSQSSALYNSLIPTVDKDDLARRPRGVLSSAASLRSTVSKFSLWSSSNPKAHFLDLPIELLDEILGNLDQTSLLRLASTSQSVSSIASRHLYFEPQFTSTYRFAQFVTTVSHSEQLASFVKVLDLSGILPGVRPGTGEVLAGWRDWKLRSEPLYSVKSNQTLLLSSDFPDTIQTSSLKPRIKLFKKSKTSTSPQFIYTELPLERTRSPESHPTQSFLLRQYANSKDIPIGAVLHILSACQNLQIVDLSSLPLANDYFVNSYRYPPSASSGLVYMSDVVQQYGWTEHEIKQVSTEDIIEAICSLRYLTELHLKSTTWLSTTLVAKLLECSASSSVKMLDFRDSGLVRDLDWAIQGDPDALKKALDSRNTPK